MFSVPEPEVEANIARGWEVEGAEQRVARLQAEQLEDEYGGVSGTIQAGLAAGARGLSAGLSDVALAGLGAGDTLRKLREANPVVSTAAEIGGAVGGALLGTGVSGAISNLGSKVAARGTLGAAVRGGVVEGALSGVGAAASELALSDKPLDVERVTSALSSNVLFGGAAGGAASLAGKALEKGLARTKAAIDEGIAARNAAGSAADDLAGLDVKQLGQRELDEVARLQAEQATVRQQLPGKIKAYTEDVKRANPWLAVSEGEQAAQLNKARKALRTQLNTPAGIAESPRATLTALRTEETALLKTLENAEGIAAKLAAADDKVARAVAEELETLPDNALRATLTGNAAKRYGAWADVKVPKAGIELTREQASEFLEAVRGGKVAGATKNAIDQMRPLLERNRAIQAEIKAATAPRTELGSPLLDQIRIAKDAAKAGAEAPKSFGEKVASGAVLSAASGAAYTAGEALGLPPSAMAALAPMIGAKASGLVGTAVFGRLGKAAAAQAERTSKAVGAFLDVTRKVAPAAPVLASRTLASVSFAPPREDRRRPELAEAKPTLAGLYRKRSEELRSQTEPGPGGRPQMRMAARQQMAARLDPIRTAAPLLADKMETLAARRLEFLASVLPRRPDYGALRTGPDNWRPSDFEMRAFARYVAAVEDPGGIEERLATGQITPEDAQVMREVYPERLLELTAQVLAELPSLQQQLPYPRRLALSLLTGVPVDPAMHPPILAALQATYSTEDGSDGGTQAPRARPQFGSVRSQEKATPAQERAG